MALERTLSARTQISLFGVRPDYYFLQNKTVPEFVSFEARIR